MPLHKLAHNVYTTFISPLIISTYHTGAFMTSTYQANLLTDFHDGAYRVHEECLTPEEKELLEVNF